MSTESPVKEFYRYEAVEYATLSYDGDFVSSPVPTPKLELRTFNLWKETPKGYWIGYGNFYDDTKLRGHGSWVSKTAKNRFAYPTKKEAIESFIKRKESQARILSRKLWSCEISINLAKKLNT